MQKTELTKSMIKLRDYQAEAVSLVIEWIRKNTLPCLLELATGAGKSIICAELAREIIALQIAKFQPVKKVLCLCPTAELVEQNYEKFLLTGSEASIYSASIGKSLKHNVVFATEGTFKAVAEEQGERFSVVIIDEAHKITPTIKKIIEDMRAKNPNLRVVGMTGTPYRLGEGYIYEINEKDQVMGSDEAKNPYFKKLLYRVTTRYLIGLGWLTPARVGKAGADSYNTESLSVDKKGNFNSKEVDKAFVGLGKKTAAIVADVLNQANELGKRGVMFFAATVKHAKEIMASLPAYNSALVTGSTPDKERKTIISDFKEQKIKYLVNVSVLTTGFDAPHVDVISILRATESAALLEQIIGRGLRLFPDKDECLVLDYAGNIDSFYPTGELFEPVIKAYNSKPQPKKEFICEKCSSVNEFSMRPNPDGSLYDSNGYFIDSRGQRVRLENGQFMPAHFGRRCTAMQIMGKNIIERCDYYWSHKKCLKCDAENDIAARNCEACGHQLIDPNSKLSIDFQKFKADLTQVQTDEIVSLLKKRPNRARPDLILVVFETPFRTFEAFFSSKVHKKFYELVSSRDFVAEKIKTVSYKMQSDSKHFHIYDFNREADKP